MLKNEIACMKRVLIVEDESITAAIQVNILERSGYDVITASSGKQALQIIKNSKELPDLILMDIMLDPEIDGIQTAELILRNYDIPIIFLSSHKDREIFEKIRNIPNYGYIIKGTGEAFLLASIDMAFDRFNINKDTKIRLDRLSFHMDKSPDLIFITDKNGKLKTTNKSAILYLGYKYEEFQNMNISAIIAPDSLEDLDAYFKRLKNKGKTSGEISIIKKDQSIGHYILDGVRINDDEFIAFCRDITNRKEMYIIPESKKLNLNKTIAEEENTEANLKRLLNEKEILIKEIHHRVNNNMQLINGMLALGSRFVTDEKALDVLRESQSRINSMQSIYWLLFKSEDFITVDLNEYMTELIKKIFHTYNTTENKIILETDIEIESVILDTNQIIPLGLIVNELLINSLKHAFPNERKGKIYLSLKKENDNLVILTFKDNGIGIPEESYKNDLRKFGLKLLFMMIEQLGGSYSIENKNGTCFVISFKQNKELYSGA